MGQEVFRLSEIGYSYGEGHALKGISFTAVQGESLGILGANGSGKSTLLKIMNGLVFPTSGEMRFSGEAVSEETLKGPFQRCFRERTGFVFPEPDVQLFSPTVFDEVAFGPLQIQLSEDEVERRVATLLEMLGIAALKDRPPYTLSSGEKKKVAIASVLATNPDVLLLDEPTNGLDPRTQVWLFELLQGLKDLKKTIIMATHDLSLVGDLCDRVIVIGEDHGVVADGPADKILRDKDLLLKANIIHEHTHRHGDIIHMHSHGPFGTHDEHE
ncbi:MAG: ABC transporter ATP-binding protein [Deltaproteobacteria bacterium]|nr:ABC transporter ATP-binding protein [Deltaproteobacteria bacterium]